MGKASRYAIRQEALAAMGFSSYAEYLRSDLWASIRERVLHRDGAACRGCDKPAISVHHVTYDLRVMRGDDLSQLISICGGCHKTIEFDGERKLTYTSDISRKLSKRVRRKHGKRAGKALEAAMRPRCRVCGRQYRRLGRDDICMGCYKSGRALKFREAAST